MTDIKNNKPTIAEKIREVKCFLEWTYVRQQLDFDKQPDAVKSLIDSFMSSIKGGVAPNDLLNILAQMIGMAIQMSCRRDGVDDEKPIAAERVEAAKAVAASIPDILNFHSSIMPQSLEAMASMYPTAKGMFVANDSDVKN